MPTPIPAPTSARIPATIWSVERQPRTAPAGLAVIMAASVLTLVTSVGGAGGSPAVPGEGAAGPTLMAARVGAADRSLSRCSLVAWPRRPNGLRIRDNQSGVVSYAVLQTHNLRVRPQSGSWPEPVPSVMLEWTRIGRGAGGAVISHTNGGGRTGECSLMVRGNGAIRVTN